MPRSPLRFSAPSVLASTRSRRTTVTALGQAFLRRPGRDDFLRVPPVPVPGQSFHAITPCSLAFALPIPPSINHQYATVNGRRVLSAKGRAYKARVGQELSLCLARDRETQPAWLRNPHAYDFDLSIWFYFASPLRRDIDGGVKITQDAICEALGLNDNRIVELHLYKRRDPEHPRIECRLSIVDPAVGTRLSSI